MAFENLVDLCEKSCTSYGDRKLFATRTATGWAWITYREFAEQVDAFRAGLAALGISKGDKVGIVSNNRVEWAVACYATYGLGAAFVPMYEAQKAEDWAFILADCGAKAVIGATSEIYRSLGQIAEELDGLNHVIGLEEPATDAQSYAAICATGASAPVDAIHPDATDTAGFIYTSGTTGKPKGVILAHSNLISNINALHEIFVFSEDRSLSFLPWAHSFGQTCELHAMLSMGNALAINDEIPNLIGNLATVQPTVLFAVPRIFNRIYDGVNAQMREKPGIIQGLFRDGISAASRRNAGESVSWMDGVKLWIADRVIFSKIRQKFGGRLKYAISGSAALNKDVARFIDALGIEVYEGYGLTETSPIATANYPDHRKIGSVGRAIPGVRIEIDRTVTGHEIDGEIVIYGPNVMQGYHNRAAENDAVMMSDGGFRSGDMGRIDDDGYVYITGRIKEQYKLENGKYVVPAPLEEELKLSPFIANVMIYGSNKPHNVALVVPDPLALGQWADEQGVQLGDLAKNQRVRQLIEAEILERGLRFKGYEKPKAFSITANDFTTENGMLTPTLKLKRRNVLREYQRELDALYSQV